MKRFESIRNTKNDGEVGSRNIDRDPSVEIDDSLSSLENLDRLVQNTENQQPIINSPNTTSEHAVVASARDHLRID